MAIDSVIFGFGYRARSGKDTAVAEIIKQRGNEYDIRHYSFADALKREVNAAAEEAGGMLNLLTLQSRRFAMCNGYYKDFPDWVQYDPAAPMDDPACPFGKQRALLQWWGTEYRRASDQDYWVRQLANTIEREKPQIALITDMRFLNEVAFCEEYGETVKVHRPDLPTLNLHPSEIELDVMEDSDFSIVLENSGTLEEFLEGAVTCFDELLLNFPQQRRRRIEWTKYVCSDL